MATAHDMSERLALISLVGDLVVAIDASQIFQIRRAAEMTDRKVDKSLLALDLDHQTIPGWDLGELFKLGPCSAAWVILDIALSPKIQRFGLRVGRCIAVMRLPKCYPFPAGIFMSRAGAICAGFSTVKLPEVSPIAPAGVVIDPRGLLTAQELDAATRIAKREAREITT